MKKLILLLMFLVSCAHVPVPTPEIVYVEITPEAQVPGWHICKQYFHDWAFSHELGATGMLIFLEEPHMEGTYLAFFADEISGLHEVGHVVDYGNGMISETEEFKEATRLYIYNYSAEYDQELFELIDYWYKAGHYGDIFAELYAWDILYELPTEFEEFYGH